MSQRQKTAKAKKRAPRPSTKRRQTLIAAKVAAGVPLQEVAEQLGIDRSNLWRELQKPETRGLLENFRAALALQSHDEVLEVWKVHLQKLKELIEKCRNADELERLQRQLFAVLQQLQPIISPPAAPAIGIPSIQINAGPTVHQALTLRETMARIDRAAAVETSAVTDE